MSVSIPIFASDAKATGAENIAAIAGRESDMWISFVGRFGRRLHKGIFHASRRDVVDSIAVFVEHANCLVGQGNVAAAPSVMKLHKYLGDTKSRTDDVLQYRVLRPFNIHLQKIEFGVAELFHDRSEPIDRTDRSRIRWKSMVTHTERNVRDVGGSEKSCGAIGIGNSVVVDGDTARKGARAEPRE